VQHGWSRGAGQREGAYQTLHVASFVTKAVRLESTDSALDGSVNFLLLWRDCPRKRRFAFMLQAVSTTVLCS